MRGSPEEARPGLEVGVVGPSRHPRPRPWTLSSSQENSCPRPLKAGSRHAAQLGAGVAGSPEAGMGSSAEAPPTEPACWCRPAMAPFPEAAPVGC